MSKINDLIKKLCPNGVEYKNIKDLCLENFWVMPSTPKYQTEGIPYITSKNIRNGIVMFNDVKYITEDDYKSISNNRPIKENDFLVSMIGTIGEVGIVKSDDLPFYGQNMYLLRLNTELVSIKFFYHYFTSDKVRNILLGEKNNGNQGYLKTKNIEMLKIPCPPLEIQEEIVRILDKFGELEAKLEAELEARKSQYEFWHGKLLNTENSNQQYITLGDIGKVCMCKRIMKNDTSDSGDIPFYKIGTFGKQADAYISYDIFNDYKNRFSYPKKGEILVSCSGTIGRSVVFDGEDAYFQDSNIVWLSNDESKVLNKFLYYFYQTSPWNISDGGTIKRLYNNQFISVKVPLYSLEEQKKIVNILERFDKLINDISVGLPAEIELRRKQYEYYRNKLLSFEEI
ncbi:MAG: restriction endonuclease subunit S [Lactobacillales bacterium]|nr:restriction endonuclease subunit S [Lactobacillales bacterium]